MVLQTGDGIRAAFSKKRDGPVPVAIVKCQDYEPDQVYDALRRAVSLAGGPDSYVAFGSHVLVKPNLLQGLPPERAVCTHPAVVAAVIRLLRERGCEVTLADSPGGGIRYTPASLARQYERAGYGSLAGDPGCTLNLDTGSDTAKYPEGKVCREFPLIRPYFSSDHVVVVSKAKTHVLTLLSGATKNLFGLVPGLEKPLLHSRFPSGERFGEMLIDLNLLVRPSLQVADAIVIMEGDGPTSGTPRHLGFLLVSPSPLALDMVLCRLMSLDPMDVAYLRCAMERGLLSPDGSDIEIIGDPLPPCTAPPVKKPRTCSGVGGGMQVTPLFRAVHAFGKVYAMRPSVDPDRCTGCGKCTAICPVHAITLTGGRARISPRHCIRCYCCHEMCTDGALLLGRGVAGSLIHRLFLACGFARDEDERPGA
ncbi:MAG: ferredoxin [Methanoregulaceae archaeon PtaB.Bin056]|nr:MAG: ferredoxin [Methanoregulaceae archaeon PtaB.Bin056]